MWYSRATLGHLQSRHSRVICGLSLFTCILSEMCCFWQMTIMLWPCHVRWLLLSLRSVLGMFVYFPLDVSSAVRLFNNIVGPVKMKLTWWFGFIVVYFYLMTGEGKPQKMALWMHSPAHHHHQYLWEFQSGFAHIISISPPVKRRHKEASAIHICHG